MRSQRCEKDRKKNYTQCGSFFNLTLFFMMAISFFLATSLLIHLYLNSTEFDIPIHEIQASAQSSKNQDIMQLIKTSNMRKRKYPEESEMTSAIEKLKSELQQVQGEISDIKSATSKLHNENEKENDRFKKAEVISLKPPSHSQNSVEHQAKNQNKHASLKSGSGQPNFQLWSEAQNDVCGGYFGNGFTQNHDYCVGKGEEQGNLQCFWNSFTNSAVCKARNILVDMSKVSVSKGGEPIESVLGREEDTEYANYQKGAFASVCERTKRSTDSKSLPFHLSKMLSSFETTEALQCSIWEKKTTLFVTRYEYANLYHTMTDWYNAFQTQKMFNLTEVGVVFFDGHSAGAMDGGWTALFGQDVKYIKHFKEQRICFRQAYFVPAGYLGALAVKSMLPKVQKCHMTKWMMNFSQNFVKSFGISLDRSPHEKKKILIIFRRDYRAHPRVKKPAARKIRNEDAVMSALKSEFPNAVVEYATFEKMSLAQQIAKVIETDVLIGIHGAALSHILFATQQTTLIELFPTGFEARRHFEYFSRYVGVKHFEVKFRAQGKDNFDLPIQPILNKVKEAMR